MEELVALIARTAGTLIEGMAVLIVTFGSVDAFGRLMWVIISPRVTHGAGCGSSFLSHAPPCSS